MYPLKLNIDGRSLFLALVSFSEVGGLSHLANPRLDCHELVTSA